MLRQQEGKKVKMKKSVFRGFVYISKRKFRNMSNNITHQVKFYNKFGQSIGIGSLIEGSRTKLFKKYKKVGWEKF